MQKRKAKNLFDVSAIKLLDMYKKPKKKKRNKQDATLININALKKRVKKLELLVKAMLKHIHM